MLKKRGRPRSSGRAASADRFIVQCVYLLDGFGFPLNPSIGASYPDGVFECVAVAALAHFGRGDAGCRPLSAKRVEQLYRGWKAIRFIQHREDGPDQGLLCPPRVWSAYTVASRRERLPFRFHDMTLLQIAETLVAARGECDLPERSEVGLQLSRKAEADMLLFPMPARLRKAWAWRPAPLKRGRPRKNRGAA